jgi:hypothetical protein
MCRITIHAQGVEITDSTRRMIERDLGAVLDEHGRRVAFAHVRLWKGVDVEGPTTCYIRVDLNPSGGLGLGATEPDLTTAVRNTSQRIGRAVGTELASPRWTAPSSWSADPRT